MADEFTAGFEVGTAYAPSQLFAGDADITTGPEKLLLAQNLAEHTVVGKIKATGKVKIWTPGATDGSEIAIGIMVYSVDATAADTLCEIYKSGCFNVDKLVWPGGATTIQKRTAFDGTAIQVRHLPGSTTIV